VNLKDRIRTLDALKSTLHVWEILAINRYRKYRAIVSSHLPYFLRLQEVLEHLYALYPGVRRGLLEVRRERRIDALVLGSDRGYIGDLISRVIRIYREFTSYRREVQINLFFVGRRGFREDLPGKKLALVEGAFGKDIDLRKVDDLAVLLMKRYMKRESDACYVFFQRPEVPPGLRGGPVEQREEKEREREEESPFFYTDFREVIRAKPHVAVERGSSRPVVIRFLPPDIRKRYSPDLILNIEAEEEEFLHTLLDLYMRFFMKEVFMEHFTSINFARYRTLRRITENIDRKIEEYKRLQNRLRQEKINREIEDIVLSNMAQEEKRERDFTEEGFILRVDSRLPRETVSLLRSRLQELGFAVRDVERRDLIGGIQLLDRNSVTDLSVRGKLESMKLYIKNILKGSGW